MSRTPRQAAARRPVAASLALAAGYLALCAYLLQPTQATGDGAAYTLQAAAGDPLARATHAGYLLPLTLWVRAWAHLGLEAATAANTLAALWTGTALAAAGLLGSQLLRDAGYSEAPAASALLAPLALLGAAATWDAALFSEVYGPLGALLLGACAAWRAGRDLLGAALFAWGCFVHPGALLLLPGALLLGGLGPERRALRVAAAVALLGALGLLALGPDFWTGGRGALRLPPFDRSPWRSLQQAWRLLARDLGPGSLPVLLGGLAAWTAPRDAGRRALLGVGLLALGAAVGVDRYRDNPGQLVTLWAACCLAPLALSMRTRAARALPALLILVGLLGVAEATSRHDALARGALRRAQSAAADCGREDGSWAERRLRELDCRP